MFIKYACVFLYNPTELVYSSINNYCSIFDKVLLFDNSEPMFDLDKSKIHFDNYQILGSGNNVGLSKALNECISVAKKEGAKVLLTMDQDSMYKKEQIIEMLNFIEFNNNPNVGMYSANYRRMYKKKEEIVFSDYNIPLNTNENVSFSMTSGSFVMLDLVKDDNLLDDWFIGMVDYDLSAYFVSKGNSIVRHGNSYFDQEIGRDNTYSFIDKLFHVFHHNKERYYYMIRNSYLFEKKYEAFPELVKVMRFQRKRIYFNILFERKRCELIRYCKKGKKDGKNGILGKISY